MIRRVLIEVLDAKVPFFIYLVECYTDVLGRGMFGLGDMAYTSD